MKNLVKSLVVASALSVAGTASADWFDCFSPVIGADYYQVWTSPKNSNLNIRHARDYPGATIYVGGRADCFGLEVGYDVSATRSRAFTAGATSGTTRVQRQGWHIDLIGYMPLDCFECVDLFGTIGWGWIQPRRTFNITSGPALGFATNNNSRRGNSVLRLGIGANYMFTECVGARLKLGYESTSTIRFTGPAGTSYRPFGDSFTLAVGAFVKF